MSMHRFSVLLASTCTRQDLAVWEDTGFISYDSSAANTLEERPDVIFWHNDDQTVQTEQPAQETPAITLIKEQLPKVFLVIGQNRCPWPDQLSPIYEQQTLQSPCLTITVGTKLEGSLVEPDWDAYRALGPLNESTCLKAIANSIYTFLLEDVIQETVDWCGHMSSALRPM